MGLRTASVRHPHAEVMAPALTEPNQSPNFKLQPNGQSASPINGTDESVVAAADYHEACVKPETNNKQFQNVKDLSNALENLNTLALATELLRENGTLGKLSAAASDEPPGEIMSSAPSLPMGDHDDKMGLSKGNAIDNVLNLFKDKSGEILPDLNLHDISAASDMHVDDIMQAIKSMESGADRLTNPGETENIFPTDLTGNLTSFAKDLFNDVDVMSMSIEEPLIENTQAIKETQTKELLADVKKKQAKIERKLEFLLRRLKKMQAKNMGMHLSGEVAGVFEHVHRTLRRLKDGPQDVISVDGLTPDSGMSNEKMKPISSSSAKNLVRKLEMTTLLQSNSGRRQGGKYFGSGSTEPPNYRTTGTTAVVTNVPSWSPQHKQDLQRVTGMLNAEFEIFQKGMDSDATASSSGGESCDEIVTYNNSHQQYLGIQKRATWKYLTDRAAIASRWTWLQAQISDLEYRIRQHSDLHKKVRGAKGAIHLGDESPPRSVPSSPTALNGYRGQLPGDLKPQEATAGGANGTINACGGGVGAGAVGGALGAVNKEYQCARTRPLVNFRKRKLLQTSGLHVVSKKAARPATVRCGCTRPNVPCALCTGRTDPTHPRDPTDYLSKSEKVAMLDPSYHPVFSLPEDCSAGIHLEAIMKTPDWQQRSSRSTIKSMKYVTKTDRVDKLNAPMEHRNKKLDHKRKYNKLLKPATLNALSAKIKNKFRNKKSAGGNARHAAASASSSTTSLTTRVNKKRHQQRLSLGSASGDCEDEELEGLCNLGRYDSPSTSPLLATQSISGFQRRNRVDSYDIDNIVIPYSVAASTRVEKLPYKEILTPKWRLVQEGDVKNNGAVKPSHDSEAEDLSEDAVISRHDRCEHDEKKRFQSYLKLPIGYGRTRGHKRTDSRAESSGANTPDPTSPAVSNAPSINADNVGSPLTSPPATPLPADDGGGGGGANPPLNPIRRRTVSQSSKLLLRDAREEMAPLPTSTAAVTAAAAAAADHHLEQHVDVAPYDRRNFPLTDETYEKMVKNIPEDQPKAKTNPRSQESVEALFSPIADEDRVNESHDSESTESAYGDEDPNDPEWVDMERVKERSKR